MKKFIRIIILSAVFLPIMFGISYLLFIFYKIDQENREIIENHKNPNLISQTVNPKTKAEIRVYRYLNYESYDPDCYIFRVNTPAGKTNFGYVVASDKEPYIQKWIDDKHFIIGYYKWDGKAQRETLSTDHGPVRASELSDESECPYFLMDEPWFHVDKSK